MNANPAPFPSRTLYWAVAATAVLVLVGVLLTVIPVQYAEVNLHWRADAPAATREAIAGRHSLQFVRLEDDADVWMCVLNDESPGNLRALLNEPAIVRVDFIDAETLQPTERPTVSMLYLLQLRHPDLPLARLVRPLGAAPLFLWSLLLSLCATAAGRRWLAARVPVASPLSMGLFRIALALALAPMVHRTVPPAATLPYLASPRDACFMLLVLFGTGALARLSWVAFLIVFTAVNWDNVAAHDFNLPLKALWLMVFVPWGDALSVDRLFLRATGRVTAYPDSQRYGLATWIPVFMVGFAYLSAAFAKLDETGLRWITDGAVRYFMVVDAPNAPGSLGRFIASHEWLAVLASAGAVASETFIIAAALWPTTLVLVVAGVSALLLHLGFWLCQGVFWYPWWALLPAFVPWNAVASWLTPIGPRAASIVPAAASLGARVARPVPVACLLALGFFALQQPLVSFLAAERLPFVSNYPMYSDVNWDSEEHFARSMEEERQPAPAIRLAPTDGTPPELLLSRLQAIDAQAAVTEAARRVAEGGEVAAADREHLADVAAAYASRFGASPPEIVVSVAHWRFDWTVADFVPRNDWQQKGTLSLVTAKQAAGHAP